MKLSEWIKSRIDDLRAIISPPDDDAPGDSCPLDGGVQQTRSSDKLDMKFCSSPANLATVRKSIEQFSGESGLDKHACEEIGLVVNEALANVIRHAYGNVPDKPVEVTVERKNPGVKISIRDWGNGKDPSKQPPREHDPLMPGGLGLICMARLMDDVKYNPQPDGMLLTMTRATSGSMAAGDDHADGGAL